MSRFNLSERIKKENAKEKEQIRLKKKHQIDQENVVVVEKSNTYKFTIKTIIAFIKLNCYCNTFNSCCNRINYIGLPNSSPRIFNYFS